jgi:ABC-type spermidine/putrescine transport system permease subunit II
VRLGVTPDINAIATLIILLVAAGVAAAAVVNQRRARPAAPRRP